MVVSSVGSHKSCWILSFLIFINIHASDICSYMFLYIHFVAIFIYIHIVAIYFLYIHSPGKLSVCTP